MILTKVISGGQKGADMAGLLAAKTFNIPTGGTAPRNFMTEDGPCISLKDDFGLIEGGDYAERTKQNVINSDGTIRLAINFSSAGERCTLNAIKQYNKPYFDINLMDPPLCLNVLTWLISNEIKILNVAGNRAKTNTVVYLYSFNYLCAVFGLANLY